MAGDSKSKILFIGGTGYIGKFIVEASAKAGHPTFVLVRESSLSNPAKSSLILGVNLVFGDLYDHQSLVSAIKQVDVVISTLGHLQLADQDKIISAIKEMLGSSIHLSLEMMWTGLMQWNQPNLHLQQRPMFAELLRLKKFPSLMCQATSLLVTSYPTCRSLELQLPPETELLS